MLAKLEESYFSVYMKHVYLAFMDVTACMPKVCAPPIHHQEGSWATEQLPSSEMEQPSC